LVKQTKFNKAGAVTFSISVFCMAFCRPPAVGPALLSIHPVEAKALALDGRLAIVA
jgi:hypothetical protein